MVASTLFSSRFLDPQYGHLAGLVTKIPSAAAIASIIRVSIISLLGLSVDFRCLLKFFCTDFYQEVGSLGLVLVITGEEFVGPLSTPVGFIVLFIGDHFRVILLHLLECLLIDADSLVLVLHITCPGIEGHPMLDVFGVNDVYLFFHS